MQYYIYKFLLKIEDGFLSPPYLKPSKGYAAVIGSEKLTTPIV
jgi:hypothetical protein